MKKKVVIVIPCRSGSKRIPDKNFQKVGGKTLISRAVRAAAGIAPTVGMYDIEKQVIVSGDSENQQRLASELASLTGPIQIIERKCGPDGPSTDVVADAIEQLNLEYDVVCMVQCTSPFIRPSDIEGCINGVLTYNQSRARTATVKKMSIKRLDRGGTYTVETGGCYASKYFGANAYLLQGVHWWAPYLVDPMRSMEIDEPHELELANIIAEAKGW